MRQRRVAAVPLATLAEEPTPEQFQQKREKSRCSAWKVVRKLFLRSSQQSSVAGSDIGLMIGILGCPLAPVELPIGPLPRLSLKNLSTECSSAQYIVQQYMAATGCRRMEEAVKSAYVAGHVKMAVACSDLRSSNSSFSRTMAEKKKRQWQSGCFVMWEMGSCPNMWSVELSVGASKVRAGSDGRVVWRYLPWLGCHAVKGPVRPLRRAIHGLDPRVVASLFAGAKCVGESRIPIAVPQADQELEEQQSKIRQQDTKQQQQQQKQKQQQKEKEKEKEEEEEEEACFVLKLSASMADMAERRDGVAEVIRHEMLGYFSHRSGLLLRTHESLLTRVQMPGTATAVYWDTTTVSSLGDYRDVDGVTVAHAGTSAATVLRFGQSTACAGGSRGVVTLHERWRIHDVAFNVPGLSLDSFLPPAEVFLASSSSSS